MRLKLLSMGILAFAALAGCKQVTKEQGTKAFYKELHLYFNNLNNEAQARKDEFRKADARLGLVQPTGSIYSTYTFDETAFIVQNYKCRTCETRLTITSPSTEYLCPSCGHCPYAPHPAGFNRRESPCKICVGADGKPHEPNATLITAESFAKDGGSVKPMFEFASGKDNPNATMVATVRYVRRQWAFDTRGVVDLSPKVIEKASVDMSYIPSEAQGSRSPGFHRLDGTYVGELEFEFRGGEMALRSRKTEEAVRPWKDLKGSH